MKKVLLIAVLLSLAAHTVSAQAVVVDGMGSNRDSAVRDML